MTVDSTIQLKDSKTWAVREALKVVERLQRGKSLDNNVAIFETGYSPSGLPHLGTAGEVIRMLMVKKAFDELVDYKIPSKLIAFIDDMDGLRKVPTNIPQQDMMKQHLGKPLTQLPDPFDCCETFAAHNTGLLRQTLTQLDLLKYVQLESSTEYYSSGKFNDALAQVMKHHQQVLDIMLPTLGEERRASYSPFLPVSPVTGKVLQVAIDKYDVEKNEITFIAEDGNSYTQTIFDGHCKLQWKPDFGMRWYALGVDYEMYGKDLIHTAELSREICKVLGGNPPINMHYELFLSETGGRISKSKGNESLTLSQWMEYTPQGCLHFFLFNNPQRAKRIRTEDVPVYVDNYLTQVQNYQLQNKAERYDNPIYYIPVSADLLTSKINLTYRVCLSMACAYNVLDLESFKALLDIQSAMDEQVAVSAYHFYKDVIQSTQCIVPLPTELHAARDQLKNMLLAVDVQSETLRDDYQNCFFQAARDHDIPVAQWFTALYQAVLGTESGPKLGTFCAMYGAQQFCNKLD